MFINKYNSIIPPKYIKNYTMNLCIIVKTFKYTNLDFLRLIIANRKTYVPCVFHIIQFTKISLQ